ncbi:MAG TPA: hypothetical protein VFP80_18810 [Thermoanaerobaculia bacterium]|nr:hypothetical protein [Thermoanaerobaculia bacterium]
MRSGGSSGQRQGASRADLIALAVLTAIVTLLFADVLLGINSLYIRDVAHYYYPAKHVLRDIVLGGDFPSWNPYFSAGQPLAANPEHEVFYPLTWLILLPSFVVGFGLLIVAHLYIAAWAMYAFLRSLALGPPAAFFGALSFVFGGIGLSYLNLLPYLFSVAWLPLICLFARRFLRDGHRRDFALAAFFFGLQLLIGEPSTILQTGMLLGVYAAFRGVRAVGRVGMISVAALLLSAVLMLPAIDHAAQSARARGFPFENVTSWSAPVVRLGELVQPNLLGHQLINGKRVYWGGALYPGRGVPFLHSIYSGLAVTALALVGLLAGVRGRRLVLVLFALSILLALGAHTPLWRWLYDAGLARSIRYPEKFLLLGLFAAVVYAAVVLDDLLANERLRRTALIVTGAITLLTAIAAVLTFTPAHARIFIALWEPPARVLAEMLALSRSGWTLAAARALLLLVLLRNLGRVRPRVWLPLFGLFVALDLGLLVPELAPRVPSDYYRRPPALAQQLPADRQPYRLLHLASWQLPSAGWYTTPQPDLYWIHRSAMYPPMPATWDIRTVVDIDYDRTALQSTEDFTSAVWSIRSKRADWLNAVAAMSNAWYCAVFVPGPEAFAKAGGDRRILQPVRLLELDPHPRYYFAERIETSTDFVAKVAGARYPDRTAFIDGTPFAPAPGRVTRAAETANTARIEVETLGRAFLVMSVTPQKYWHITIDGRQAPAIVTNLGFQGVVIPTAGRHVVEMRYRNPLIAIGAAISLLTAAGLVVLSRR